MSQPECPPVAPLEEHPITCHIVAEWPASLADGLAEEGVWPTAARHRVAPAPFVLNQKEASFIRDLGRAVWSFYNALNHLYLRKGNDWAREWLDQGKPGWLTDFSRMNYSKQHLPRLLRPDLILAEDRMWVTELDSVPGGAGETAALASRYAAAGMDVIGGADGVPRAFARAVSDVAGNDQWTMAIVVSEESEDYRPEMSYLASRLRSNGFSAWCVHPQDVLFDEEGLWLDNGEVRARIDVLWRFYELFDLKNIPKSELFMYAGKKRRVAISPPYKPYLEEKLALGLIRHEALRSFFEEEMGEHYQLLRTAVPETWVLDPRPVPPHASIPNLTFRGRPVRDFLELSEATQKERRMVVKPSGFSPYAWGSRGVVAGHDVAQEDWARALQLALEEYPRTPHILQRFEEGRSIRVDYYDPRTGRMDTMMGRARLSPYYYVADDEPVLAGVLATICRADKKLIHGMSDAVMTVCAEGS